MKPILDLTKAIGNEAYFNQQFGKWGDEKNILFVNPQLSGKCLYKMILPFFSMYNEKVATAISGLSRYDYEGQLLGGDEINLEEEMIEWADFIVFPFTTQPLVSEFYSKIRSVNEDVKIVFLVDFNFYELSSQHPFRRIFDEPSALSAVEDNVWFSDLCFTSNSELSNYLVEKFKLLGKSKYAETVSYLAIACMPYMIDTEVVLKNIEYDPTKPIIVNPIEHSVETKKHIEDVSKVANEIKESDLEKKNKLEVKKPTEPKEPIIPEPTYNKEINTKENGNSKEQKRKSKKIADKPIAKKSAKPTAKPSAKPTAKPTAKRAVKPIAKPTKSAAKKRK